MESIKIAIISKSEKIRDFFRLEALELGFFVDSFEKIGIHTDFSAYDLAIIDIDSVTQKPLNSAKKQLTVSEGTKKADILYPTSILTLRAIYCSLLKNESSVENTEKETDIKLIFYKDKENLISIKGKNYLLSDTEYNLLKLLCKRTPNVVLREEIDEMFSCINSNISDVYICKLRKKLEEPLGQRLILTVRSKGYRIVIKSEWR